MLETVVLIIYVYWNLWSGPGYPMGIIGTGPGAHAHLGPKPGEENNLGVSLH